MQHGGTSEALQKAQEACSEIHTENVVGSAAPDQYFVINGQKAYVSIDGKTIDSYLTKEETQECEQDNY